MKPPSPSPFIPYTIEPRSKPKATKKQKLAQTANGQIRNLEGCFCQLRNAASGEPNPKMRHKYLKNVEDLRLELINAVKKRYRDKGIQFQPTSSWEAKLEMLFPTPKK